MKKKLLITLLILVASTALFFLWQVRRMTPGREAPDSPAVGTNAPDFSVTDSKGQTQSVSQYKGKYVVLEWFNPECPFVKKHYGSGNMQKLQEEFTEKDIVWLTIDSSAPGKQGHLTAEEANQKITNLKMKSTALVIDADGKAGQTYGAKTTPHMFVINLEGKIIYQGAIDSKNSTSAADIPSSTNYVRVALEESLAGKPVSTATTQSYGCSVKYN
jgi:peroxiredoxin